MRSMTRPAARIDVPIVERIPFMLETKFLAAKPRATLGVRGAPRRRTRLTKKPPLEAMAQPTPRGPRSLRIPYVLGPFDWYLEEVGPMQGRKYLTTFAFDAQIAALPKRQGHVFRPSALRTCGRALELSRGEIRRRSGRAFHEARAARRRAVVFTGEAHGIRTRLRRRRRKS